MINKFNLSEKSINFKFDVEIGLKDGKLYHEDDVKEFIRLIKKNLNNKKIEIKLDTIIYQKDMIDKLAGDKLK